MGHLTHPSTVVFMERSRSAVAAIHNNLKGDLSRLLEEIERNPQQDSLTSAAAVEYRRLTDEAIWEALYTLANEIDLLRSKE